ncbi:glycosyltransferase [bacterium]|nr:glycosyltransferase [bacterium]
MRILWLCSMFPSSFDWLSGPWNIRGTVALRDCTGHAVRVVCPVGMTPPPALLRQGVTKPGVVREWLRERGDSPRAGEVRGIPVTYPRWRWGPKKLLWGYEGWFMYRQLRKHLAEIVREFKPDVVHAPWISPEGVCASMMGREHGLPVVVQGIGNDANVYLHEFPHSGYVIKHVRRASALLFNCRSTRNAAAAAGLTHPNTHIIFHGVETDLFEPDANRTEFGHRIITVAQLLPRKNHQLLLHAFTHLPADLRDSSTLYFVGGGPLKSSLEDLAKDLGIADRVTVAGRLPHEEMVREMQQSDIFCLPTLSEGMPVATIEAMSVGLPVVASRTDGLPETIAEPTCGILVPPADVKALTDALVEALRRQWDRRAIREHVLSNYTWEQFADKITELYESVR